MQPISAYINECNGKAYQRPLACLRDEFDHLLQEAAAHCIHCLSHKRTDGPGKLTERFAEIRAKLDRAEAKGREYYALAAQMEAQRKPIAPPANVVQFPQEKAA